MLTSFGKFCRKLRIDNGELLKNMSDKLGVTSSYLSAVENGKRNVPENWFDKITDLYELNNEMCQELSEVIEDSKINLKINFSLFDKGEKEILLALAREVKNLDEDDKVKIKNILMREKD